MSTSAADGAGSLAAAVAAAGRGECRGSLDEATRRRYETYVPVSPGVHLVTIAKSAVIPVPRLLPEMQAVNGETLILRVAAGATVQLSGTGYADSQPPLRIAGRTGNVIVDGIGLEGFATTAVQADGRDHLLLNVSVSGSGSATAPALRIAGSHSTIAESRFSQNSGDAIRIADCVTRPVIIAKTHVSDNAGAGIRVRAVGADIHDSNIHHNHGVGIAVDRPDVGCPEAPATHFTAELRRNTVHHNADGVAVAQDELVPPTDLVMVSAPSAANYRIVGNIGRNPVTGYPWDDAHLDLKNAVIDLFVTEDARSRQAAAYVGSTTVYDVGRRLFIATIPRPLVINGKEIANPVFVATLTDPEHHNSSRYSDPLDVAAARDWDRDGIQNDEEDLNQNGQVDFGNGETDPRLRDSDGDGLTDGTELLHRSGFEEKLHWALGEEEKRGEEYLGKDHVVTSQISFKDMSRLNPTRADSDEDCLPDGLELGVAASEFPAVAKSQYSTLQTPLLVISNGCLEILKAHKMYQADLTAPEKSVLGVKNILLRDPAKPATLANLVGIYDTNPATRTDPTNKDTDNDRLMDGAEDWNWDGKRTTKVEGQKDQQPATNFPITSDQRQEERGNWIETDPLNPDSDKDSLLDGDEDKDGNSLVDKDEASPLLADSDRDGVNDAQEVKTGANPTQCDSDGDGEPDGIENNVAAAEVLDDGTGQDPGKCPGAPAGGTNFASPLVLSSSNVDSDGDGLKDGEEDKNHNGWLDPSESDPTRPDTDGDGSDDTTEMHGDINHDGVADFFVGDITNGAKCNPPKDIFDVDCDGLSNAQDSDSDNDGCPDETEGLNPGNNPHGIPAAYTREVRQCGNGAGSPSGAGAGAALAPKPGGGNGLAEPAEGGVMASEGTEVSGSWNTFWKDRTDGGGDCSLLSQNGTAPSFPLFFLAALVGGMLVSARCFFWDKVLINQTLVNKVSTKP